MLSNTDILGVVLAAAIAGIGVAIGNAIYKAVLEEKVMAFLDKQHRAKAIEKLRNLDLKLDEKFKVKPINSASVVDNMLGRTSSQEQPAERPRRFL